MSFRHESSPMVQKAKRLAIEAVKFVSKQQRNLASDVIMRQLVRSATSVGANSRAALRARSNAEMIAKLGIVEEEADECMFWIEILIESGFKEQVAVAELSELAEEVLKMTIAAIRTLKSQSANVTRESVAEYAVSDFDSDAVSGLDECESLESGDPLSASRSPL